MRIMPGVLAMHLLCGRVPPHCRLARFSLADRVREGRQSLVSLTGVDLGYDPEAWDLHLRATKTGGYVHAPRRIAVAINDPRWQQAVAALRAEEAA